MWAEMTLRQISVGKRAAVAGLILVLPMTILIVVSMAVLGQQETDLQKTIEEALDELAPLATLEYELQHAQSVELEAGTRTTHSSEADLTRSVDRLFSELQQRESDPNLPHHELASAIRAWRAARPSVARLSKPPWNISAGPSAKAAEKDLDVAIHDVGLARRHLSETVRARTISISTAQKRQLRLLGWTWAVTLLAALLVLAAMVYSVVKPARQLKSAVRKLGQGDLSVRIDSRARDELAVVAAYLNAMAERFASRKVALESEANQDPLTGLPNRRAVLARLDAALAPENGQQPPVSVLMIDVDHFKHINDTYGHSSGDDALKWLADSMSSVLRGDDILGRYAGDEFLAVLPETNVNQAREIAIRLCETIREQASDDPQRPSITVGVATSDANNDTPQALLDAADRRLYEGKQRGRGRVAAPSG